MCWWFVTEEQLRCSVEWGKQMVGVGRDGGNCDAPKAAGFNAWEETTPRFGLSGPTELELELMVRSI
jgi:hypothetical protein